MKRIVALQLRQSDRLEHIAYLKGLYRDYGLWETYAFAPVLLLDGISYDDKIDIKDGFFTFTGKTVKIDDFYALEAEESINGSKPALFIARGRLPEAISFTRKTVKVKSLLLIEYDEESYRVIRQRPLRMDR